jgi:beta-glucosidase
MTTESTTSSFVFQDPTRPFSERVQDLLGRMTLAEKISQMCDEAPAIPHLGIHAYGFWNEALHGVARNGRATVFPQVIGMAATWDPALIERVASAVGDEARAKYHETVRKNGRSFKYQGLNIWAPNINIFRDPRWGRGQETWGEDPILTGEMGAAYVRGLQGDHPVYLKTAACAKHYAVHSGPEGERHIFDAQASPRDLYDTYLPAFKKLVMEAKVEAVMGAYNRTNGEACCASPFLLQNILRDAWGFAGHVVSDCGALIDLHKYHHLTADAVESAALALKNGCDLSCVCTYAHLAEAIERGLVTETDIDQAVARVLTMRFKLGIFDPPDMVPFADTPMSVVNSPEHKALAYETAVKSITLLKNNDILPIQDDVKSIMVVGPNATSLDVLLGNYHGLSDTMTTVLEGIAGAAPEGIRVNYQMGCMLDQPARNPQNWTIGGAAGSDVTIACMGLAPVMEGEEGEAILTSDYGDRSDIGLPAAQVEFVTAMVNHGAKVVLVLFGGSPIALGELADLVEAILFVYYQGQAGGTAVADILFGKTSPSGKLPLTFPQSLDQLPPYRDYDMSQRTYRYSQAEPLYPFGFGLSYTEFVYSDLVLEQVKVKVGEGVNGRFSLTNCGTVAAEEVAQIYLTDVAASVLVPQHKLVTFERVQLAAGTSRTLSFTITPEMMMLINDEGQAVLEPGQFKLTIGGCSPSTRGLALGASEPVGTTFAVV